MRKRERLEKRKEGGGRGREEKGGEKQKVFSSYKKKITQSHVGYKTMDATGEYHIKPVRSRLRQTLPVLSCTLYMLYMHIKSCMSI